MQDELGSPLRVLYATGRGECYGYDEFGQDLAEEKRDVSQEDFGSPYVKQGTTQLFGYTGYRYDGISGSYFAQAREYQPHTGRFMAEDVIRGRVAVPKTLNRYGYCLSNPVRFVDLNGKTPIVGRGNMKKRLILGIIILVFAIDILFYGSFAMAKKGD